ncbi:MULTISPECIES: ATP-binding cassette domain-containing protein [unclassified Spirosoma]|uniref:ABC transporter ATP-binding protein n=1 Tax=unclassified Spirosoma TaxID=2621999 RepID=UPI0009685DA2|nr:MULTISPECIES: ATP-binding cassette domain-containing protein [unclassified Spirosoma]MBN8823196.1 ATP-binding cassette domain-containing protein [Spirosoma sp.]OJW72653.1 MAG: ABC transporter ATP-binding protein [Spirosoma sp. 48-14]
MHIAAEKIGKKYRKEWIFRRVDLTLTAGNSYTFVGPNGSGKSTLLQLLAGSLPITEGTLTYSLHGKALEDDDWFRYVTIAAPYLELIEELTLDELLTFHQTFKPFVAGQTPETIAEKLWLSHARDKEIKYFSSGMKQRVKLGLAFFSSSPIIILDEPTSNLDRQGMNWYQEQVQQLIAPINPLPRLLLIGSNQPEEYDFCPNVIDITQWK